MTHRWGGTACAGAPGGRPESYEEWTEHLPGEAAWLVGEWRDTGEKKYYPTNHPPTASLRSLAAAIKARWSCEQAHQQLKDRFAARSSLALTPSNSDVQNATGG